MTNARASKPRKTTEVKTEAQLPYTHCPEHGCKLEPDGECLGCTDSLPEDYYPILHD